MRCSPVVRVYCTPPALTVVVTLTLELPAAAEESATVQVGLALLYVQVFPPRNDAIAPLLFVITAVAV